RRVRHAPLLFGSCRTPRMLHSFPTRRSSDLFTVYHYTIGTTTNSTNPILVNGATVADGGTVAVPVMNNYTTYFPVDPAYLEIGRDRKSTRLNSSHGSISYAVFCLKKKTDKLV